MNHLPNLFRKSRLILYLEANHLHLALASQGKIQKTERIFLRETPEELICEKVSQFLDGTKIQQSILVLPRSEVIQKELVLSRVGDSDLKEALEQKLEELLPYSRKEMAYGFSLEPNGNETQGLLFALPEKHLREKLEFLKAIGLRADEIITEDQALFWLVCEKEEKGPFLVMDQRADRILLLSGRAHQLLFSRTFSKTGSPEFGFPPEFFEEMSLALLEKGLKPEKLFLAGSWNEEVQAHLKGHFNSPVEKLERSSNGESNIPNAVAGANLLGRYPHLSLLPQEEKIRNKKEEKKKLRIQTFGCFSLFFLSLVLAFLVHVNLKAFQIKKLDREFSQILPRVKETKDIVQSLGRIRQAQNSKEKTLSFLKDLTSKVPSQVSLKELSIDQNEFFFKGESPSHGSLSETVEVLSQINPLEEVRLQETRLRKRMDEEYFEFEVRGKWGS